METREAIINVGPGATSRRQLPLLKQKFATHLIPQEIKTHLLRIAKDYGDNMILKPTRFRQQRIIIEQGTTELDEAIVARLLLIAEFGAMKGPTALSAMIPARVEDWMVTLLCERHEDGILLFAEELYVARPSGWERVHQKDYTQSGPQPMGAKAMTEDGAEWPLIEHRA
jgi:hypothetical protein